MSRPVPAARKDGRSNVILPLTTTFAGAGWETATVTEASSAPPGPVHESENVASSTSEPNCSEPAGPRAPLHPPLAMHELAFVLLQTIVVASPATIAAGFALSVTIGAGAGALLRRTVIDCDVVPPGPEQDSVNVVF